MKNIKSLFEFQVTPAFETFFALQTLTDANSRIHESWRKRAYQRLPDSFHRKFQLIGASPYLWPVIADTVLDVPVLLPFDQRISAIAGLSLQKLQKTIFLGIFHEPEPVNHLLSGRYDLVKTITRVSKRKREWLAFLGLYPPKKNSPLLVGLESLLRAPSEFQRIVVDLLEIFWDREFRQTWDLISPKLEKSREEKERLFQSCSLEEFARLAMLRVEIDERKGVITPVRGGYSLPVKHLLRAVILPSAFNDKRHWTAEDENPTAVTAYFPYFDPAISLNRIYPADETQPGEPELDPALIFKALGDTTRYAMVSLLAKDPATSADLAKALGLSRPTVSHHIHVLREASLLEEKIQGNSIVLSFRREVIENLSELATSRLYRSSEQIDLKKTRNK